MTNSNTIISLQNVSKVFRTDEIETHALSNIGFDIQKGEFLSIAGPSGCGKSTLLSILGLLDVPSSGSYLINGQSTENLDLDQRARLRCESIGFVFQAFNLIGNLSVFENVELPLTYRDDMSKSQRLEKVNVALEKVGMSHRNRHFPGQLSGGQQQRVAVARALVSEPTLLLADEPTGNLDSKNGEAVIQLLSDLNQQGTTICMVTHDTRYADLTDRVVQLFDGKMVDEQIPLHPMAANQ
ncbi:ABC transporter ATP-binding protein [Aliiglaciecola sp. M165]|uniref:ABC transporter ATP-binding protein n=1 Tax=Aliiglaciecola sp. M165 TaxID=2593649 RepID=UPI00117CD686|nr:ABC transporter ATP-binding protein [Aliiglaciecola sp. M165]TRY34015.1 ABC transporter ATP-binding protein [Aliiglaciecola sp. M165]